jgi:AcrR family transcriptional regulator
VGKAGPSALTIREHILDRTIYLMGKEGTTEVSVRAIAKEAGVNVAAVNYYFSSKDQMLAEMGDRFLHGYDEVMRLLDDPSLSAEKRLRRWAAEVMYFLADYPGILALMERQIAAEPLNPFGKALRSGVTRAVKQLSATIKEIIGKSDAARLAFKVTLLISTLAGPFPQKDKGDRNQGLRTFGQQRRFLDLLLEHLRQ